MSLSLSLRPPCRPRQWRASGLAAPLATGLFLLGNVAPAHAQINDLVVFRSLFGTQTGPATTVINTFSFDARLPETNVGDATTATLTYPGPGSPAAMLTSVFAPTTFDDRQDFASQAALDTAFPIGTYTADWSGGSVGTGNLSVNYAGDAFALSTPTFDAATWAALGAENASQPITLGWNAFLTNAGANEHDIFFNVFDSLGTVVFSQAFLPSSTSGVMIPGGTLLPSSSYTVSLDFSERINGTTPGGFTTLGFDRFTSASLVTAAAVPATAPEPGTSALILAGALPLIPAGLSRIRKSRSSRIS